jgi:formylglycine-generating enzyme required for sulfatase activity
MSDYVFISYSRKDQAYARQLVDHLRASGFEVWIDDRIDFGSRWWQTIVEAIQRCAALIVIMSPDSEASEWVEREIHLALRERKPVFPLLLRGKGFALLITRQYVKVTDGRMPPPDFYDRLRQVVPTMDHVASPAGQLEKAETGPPRTPFEPEMVPVPAGELLMGSDPKMDPRAKGSEQPQHILPLPAYSIAKTPVTNAEFLAFVQAVDRPPPSHWANERPLIGEERHPVVHITWHDAVAYCNWLSSVTGRSFCLPSEAEWEKAARGSDGRLYPWGDRWEGGRCNTAQSGTWTTTPVDAHPQGASPYGLLDMAGNVWEWTRSLHCSYPYEPTDGREALDVPDRRVLRGGSFGYKPDLARCAYRMRLGPENLGKDIGFRVAISFASGS